MAIDGVKIIDSDDGYDIYNYIIESYKDGVSADKIIADMLADGKNYCTDEFYAEIYWTSFAYSLWKIGHLPDVIKDKTLEIIEKGANEFWLEIDSKALKQRQKILDKLAVQLQSKNLKPVKVTKGKIKRVPYFNKGEVLVIKFDNEYGVCFVSATDKSPRKIEYHLACTRLLQKEKPSMDDFFCSQIACSLHDTKYWINTDCWFNHKDLGNLLDRIEKIGKIEPEDYLLGVIAPAHTLEDLYDEFTSNKETWSLRFKDTYYLIRNFEVYGN